MNPKPLSQVEIGRLGRHSSIVFFLIFALGSLSRLWAHPDLIEQITSLTARIAEAPTNGNFYLRRADIYRRHEECTAAHADLTAAEKLAAPPSATLLLRAQIFWDEGKTADALRVAGAGLRMERGNPALRALRGRCLIKSRRFEEGIADFSAALRMTPLPSPDLLIERANAQAANHDWAGAVAGLQEGSSKLGPIPSLELPALEYERRQRKFTEALTRVDRLVARYPVKEPWLALRGEVLEEAGRFAEAEIAFSQVLESLARYAPHRRGLVITRQLEERARLGLTRIQARSGTQSAAFSTSSPLP